MNVFLKHHFEQVKNNLTYSFSAPIGAKFEDAQNVLDLFKQQLAAMEQQSEKKEEPQEENTKSKKEE